MWISVRIVAGSISERYACRPTLGFHITVERLPFFAYGTLLPEQPNYWLWQEAIFDLRPAKFADSLLLDLGNYPMLIESRGREVKGALVTIKASSYNEILKRLDRLEGFDPADPEACVFCRVRRTVYLNEGESAPAWLYMGQADMVGNARVIQSGDWVDYSRLALSDIVDWWDLQGPGL
jgi:gamma-glutamylcyclotransferase (GGCT)/AIG2-like uncharacterized protein YtfP